MGNQVKDILLGAIPIAIGFVVANVIYKQLVDRSASSTATGSNSSASAPAK